MIFNIIYIYSHVYLCIYTPSYQYFKAFPVSNFNSETSFLYQLFKENSNFILVKPCKVISLSIFSSVHSIIIYEYICIFMHFYTLISTFKALPVSKFNSKTSFLYHLFKDNSNFIV